MHEIYLVRYDSSRDGPARETWNGRHRERGIDPGARPERAPHRRDGHPRTLAQLGRTFDGRFLLEPGELRDAFPGLDVPRFEEGWCSR